MSLREHKYGKVGNLRYSFERYSDEVSDAILKLQFSKSEKTMQAVSCCHFKQGVRSLYQIFNTCSLGDVAMVQSASDVFNPLTFPINF